MESHSPQDPLDAALLELGIPPRPPLPPRPALPVQPAADLASPEPGARSARVAKLVLAVYLIILAGVAVWPVPVDSGAGPVLRAVTRIFPILTYARIEFGANILLFVPLGALLALILAQRYLIVPIALVTTVAIESMQALMLERRTPSVMDIIANLTGACIGLLIVALIDWARRRPAD